MEMRPAVVSAQVALQEVPHATGPARPPVPGVDLPPDPPDPGPSSQIGSHRSSTSGPKSEGLDVDVLERLCFIAADPEHFGFVQRVTQSFRSASMISDVSGSIVSVTSSVGDRQIGQRPLSAFIAATT
jgi:hypothetical protein